jgi:glucose-1-phosphatase
MLPTQLKSIKNIIFDLGGVILNIDYQLTSDAFKKIGFTDFDSFYSQKEQSNIFDLLETGKISSENFIAEIRKHFPSENVSDAGILEAWNAMLLDLPMHRIELLHEVAKKYRIFLLSNTNQIHLEAFSKIITNAYGSDVLSPCFEKVYLSHQIGDRKPNASCFDMVLNENQLIPEETLFIDDSIQHIKSAESCGIHALFLDVKNGEEITRVFPDIILPKHHS